MNTRLEVYVCVSHWRYPVVTFSKTRGLSCIKNQHTRTRKHAHTHTHKHTHTSLGVHILENHWPRRNSTRVLNTHVYIRWFYNMLHPHTSQGTPGTSGIDTYMEITNHTEILRALTALVPSLETHITRWAPTPQQTYTAFVSSLKTWLCMYMCIWYTFIHTYIYIYTHIHINIYRYTFIHKYI